MKTIRLTLQTLAAAFVLFLPMTANAGVEAVLAKGFNPNVAYHMADFDAVNTFTGDLTLNVPLGPVYKSNGSLSYQFNLNYSPDFWSYIEYYSVGSVPGTFGSVIVRRDEYGNIRLFEILTTSVDAPEDGQLAGTEAIPTGTSGAGWNVGLGSYAGAEPSEESFGGIYTDGSGASHQFGRSMHSTSLTGTGVFYTHDGSYLRLRHAGADREIDFPDGTVKHFKCVDFCTEWRAQWMLQWISDPFGNVLRISRSPSEKKPPSGEWVWTLEEGTVSDNATRLNPFYQNGDAIDVVRRHKLTFNIDFYNPAYPWIGERLVRADLAGPNGDWSTPFTFQYEDKNILRTMVLPWTGEGLVIPYIPTNNEKRIKVTMLKSITLPENAGKWQFDYEVGTSPAGPDDDGVAYSYCLKSPSFNCTPGLDDQWIYPTSRLAGRMKSARWPAGGGWAYQYKLRAFGSRSCAPHGIAEGPAGGPMMGLSSRQQLDENGNSVAGALWRYSGGGYMRTFIDEHPQNGVDDSVDVGHSICRAAKEYLAAMLDPNGLLTINFYNLQYGNNMYGAPFTPLDSRADTLTRVDGSTVRRNLSSRSYNVDMNPAAGFNVDGFDRGVWRLFPEYRLNGDPGTTATLLRSQYADYDSSDTDCTFADGGNCEFYNLRLRSEHTRFHDDTEATTPAFVETINSDFDGVGHYRQTDVDGNLRSASQGHPVNSDWDYRIEYKYFNPDITWAPRQANPSGLPSVWNLETFTHASVMEKDFISSSRFFFDPKRAFLRVARKMKSNRLSGPIPDAPQTTPATVRPTIAALGADDFMTVVTRTIPDDVRETIVREEYYGGDFGGLGTEWTITGGMVEIPATAERDYTIDTTYRHGAVARVEYKGCDVNTLFLESMSASIGAGSGLPDSLKESNGLTSTYTYDALGRIKKVIPPGGTEQTYDYLSRTGAGGANRLTISRTGGNTRVYDYDAMGRLAHETHSVPTGTTALTATTTFTYTPTGELDTESLPFGGSIKHKYDVLGRENYVKGADGFESDVKFFGARETLRTIHGVALADGVDAHLTSKLDSFGRVVEISDDVTHADYTYDVLSNLTSAGLKKAGGGPVQYRTFEYDGRGVLVRATHPELNNGSRQVDVQSFYDARGHVIRTDFVWKDGGTLPSLSGWRLSTTFDRAERVTSVWNPQRTFKDFIYYSNTDLPGRRNQLQESVRHNYAPDPAQTGATATFEVTDDFTYKDCATPAAGCNGLLSRDTTTVSPPSGSAFLSAAVSYDYDHLGQMMRIDYPVVDGTAAGARSVQYGYQYEYLISVFQGGARRAEIFYHLNGVPKSVQYAAAAAKDTIPADSSGLPRPGGFEWAWNGTTQRSGTYKYDGGGNISGIGVTVPGTLPVERYKYDQGSRVKSADMGNGNVQTYDYDGYGNLIGVATTTPSANMELNAIRSITVGPSNNRLASPVVYDDAGNITSLPDPPHASIGFAYDALNAMTQMDGGSIGRVFVYDANDERIGVIDYKNASGRRELWSIRDAGNRVLSDFERTYSGSTPQPWTWKKDYVYRGPTLSNTVSPGSQGNEVRDIHVDHLGSVRYVTNSAGNLVTENGATTSGTRYFPFGKLLFRRTLDERLAFTGHERDDGGTAGEPADLDYMHARYYSPYWGRFLSVDPGPADTNDLQTWNRYTYAANNPVRRVDPDGRYAHDFHFDISSLMGLAAGVGANAANRIAIGTQAVDEDARGPFRGAAIEFFTMGAVVPNRLWHFVDPARLDQLANAAFSGGSPRDLGTFLHAYQDTFAHSAWLRLGFHPNFSPDRTEDDPEKALNAARETYGIIVAWAQANGRDLRGRVPFEVIEDQLRALLRTRGDSVERILAVRQLQRRINDLAAPRREPVIRLAPQQPGATVAPNP
jgi:RHS repeat-associated protein